jgi:hypothetical protein
MKRIIVELIDKLELNLSSLTIATEVASDDYVYLPLIAALAGAEKVYALGRDSSYGKFKEHKLRLEQLAVDFGVDEIIEIHEVSDFNLWDKCDVVTNSGMIRPFNSEKIKKLKPTAVIPLMWETWEFRPDEIDLKSCQKSGIPVIGTEEKYHSIDMYHYPGMLALKMLFDVQSDFSCDRIALVGGGLTGTLIAKTISLFNDDFLWFGDNRQIDLFDREPKLLNELDYLLDLDYLDVVFFAEHSKNEELIGVNSVISFDVLKQRFPELKIVHLCGNIDQDNLKASGLSFHPDKLANYGHMSVFPSVMSPKPTIKLFAGGLKVGELAANVRKNGGSIEQAISATVDHGIGQDFPGGFMNYS